MQTKKFNSADLIGYIMVLGLIAVFILSCVYNYKAEQIVKQAKHNVQVAKVVKAPAVLQEGPGSPNNTVDGKYCYTASHDPMLIDICKTLNGEQKSAKK